MSQVMAVAGPAIQLGLGVASAGATLSAGKAQQRGYEQQSKQALIRGRQEALAWKQKGADALKNLNETLAAITARAAAGGVDATSGSARTIAEYAQGEGIREANIAADNAAMAMGQASQQAFIYREAGYTAYKTSQIQAVSTLAQSAFRYGQLL